METIRTIELENGKKVEFYYSQGDSREWDNFTKMICFHKRYNLGDKHDFDFHDYSSFDEMEKDIIKKENAVIIKPLYMYDHSGITIATTPFSCHWDSGQIGFVIVTKEQIRKEYEVKRVTKKLIEKAEKVLDSEVETYCMEVEGEVFGFMCYDENGDMTDSCGGFYGRDFEKNGMLGHIEDDEIRAAMEKEKSI